MNNTCKNCKHFNFKVGTDNGNFGECLNPKNEKAYYTSVVKCDTELVTHEVRKEIKEYSDVYFNEDFMSCINFEKSNINPDPNE